MNDQLLIDRCSDQPGSDIFVIVAQLYNIMFFSTTCSLFKVQMALKCVEIVFCFENCSDPL